MWKTFKSISISLVLTGCVSYDGPYDQYHPTAVTPFENSGKSAIVYSGEYHWLDLNFFGGIVDRKSSGAFVFERLIGADELSTTNGRRGVLIHLRRYPSIAVIDPGTYSLRSITVEEDRSTHRNVYVFKKDQVSINEKHPAHVGFHIKPGEVLYLGDLEMRAHFNIGGGAHMEITVSDKYEPSIMKLTELKKPWRTIATKISRKNLLKFHGGKW